MPEADGPCSSSTLADARQRLVETFTAAQMKTPELDARLLLCHVLGITDSVYFALPDLVLSKEQSADLERLVMRRLKGEPISRLMGKRAFWKHEFNLGSETLDPRPDSETLIEAALSLFDEGKGQAPLNVLDLGTGSGALLISLLHEFPHARGTGVDLSAKALDVARDNARRTGVLERAAFHEGNWLEGIDQQYDLIVCNPPYIPSDDIDRLEPEVAHFDPRLALDGGCDGLAPYRKIIPQLGRYLLSGGVVIFEIGAGQHEDVMDLMMRSDLEPAGDRSGYFRDLSGVIRCVAAQKFY